MADPNGVRAQRDLTQSLDKLGELAGKMGQLGEAKAFYERSVQISEKQAAADPEDARAQRDLSIGLRELGELARKMGQLAKAQASFERSFYIRERLAAADPRNVQSQHDLIWSHIYFARLHQMRKQAALVRQQKQAAAAILAKIRGRLTRAEEKDLDKAMLELQ